METSPGTGNDWTSGNLDGSLISHRVPSFLTLVMGTRTLASEKGKKVVWSPKAVLGQSGRAGGHSISHQDSTRRNGEWSGKLGVGGTGLFPVRTVLLGVQKHT